MAVRPRRDVQWEARMQEAHGAGQRDLCRAQDQHFAAHAAKIRERVPRAKAAAIEDRAALGELRCIDAELNGDAESGEAIGEIMQRAAWVEMTFLSEEQASAESSGEVRLQRGDARFLDALVILGARCKAIDLAGVARRRDDQRAVAGDAGDAPLPPGDRLLA